MHFSGIDDHVPQGSGSDRPRRTGPCSTCSATGEGCEHKVENHADYDTLLVGEDSEWTFYAYEEPLTQDLS